MIGGLIVLLAAGAGFLFREEFAHVNHKATRRLGSKTTLEDHRMVSIVGSAILGLGGVVAIVARLAE